MATQDLVIEYGLNGDTHRVISRNMDEELLSSLKEEGFFDYMRECFAKAGATIHKMAMVERMEIEIS